MKILKFNLNGRTAFFKRPDVNTFQYFTYSHIHKVALLGILGSILGLKGYNHQVQENTEFPEFYEVLKDIKISIAPRAEKGFFYKKIQTFNNSVGYASYEAGGNLIVKEQWLENPEWDIYIQLDKNIEILKELKSRLEEFRFKYIPYLGKNDHFANIKNIEILNGEKVNQKSKISSFIRKDNIDSIIGRKGWKLEDTFPIGITNKTNQYILKELVLTTYPVTLKDYTNLWEVGEDIVFFQ